MVIAVVGVVAAACSRQPSDTAPPERTESTPAPPTVAPASGAAGKPPLSGAPEVEEPAAGEDAEEAPTAAAESLNALRAPEGIPPLALDPPESRAIQQSRKLNAAGYRLHRDGKLDEAADNYREALTRDPGNLLARYNLASAHLRMGEQEPALAILKQLKDAGCRFCLGIVIHARGDDEWASVRGDERFVELTAGVAVENPKPEAVMKDIARVHRSENDFEPKKKLPLSDDTRQLFHPRRPLKVYAHDPPTGRSSLARTFADADAFTEWLHDPLKGYLDALESCKPKGRSVCCSFEIGMSEDNFHISNICLKKAAGGVLYLDRMDI